VRACVCACVRVGMSARRTADVSRLAQASRPLCSVSATVAIVAACFTHCNTAQPVATHPTAQRTKRLGLEGR
jgi:hypothetical protein